MPTVAVTEAMLRMTPPRRSEEHTSELQSQSNLVCRLLLEKKKNSQSNATTLHMTSVRRRSRLLPSHRNTPSFLPSTILTHNPNVHQHPSRAALQPTSHIIS